VEGRGGGLTFGVISAGCVRARKGGMSKSPQVSGVATGSEGARDSRPDPDGATSEVAGAAWAGAMVRGLVGLDDGVGAAPIEEVLAGLLWWSLAVGAGGGRSMPPLRGGN
jgi:hypothetical protein